jgi:hypothetical protein
MQLQLLLLLISQFQINECDLRYIHKCTSVQDAGGTLDYETEAYISKLIKQIKLWDHRTSVTEHKLKRKIEYMRFPHKVEGE